MIGNKRLKGLGPIIPLMGDVVNKQELPILHKKYQFNLMYLTYTTIYFKIPILRPPLGLSKSGLKDHFWKSQTWSLIEGTPGVGNKERNDLNFANKVFNG